MTWDEYVSLMAAKISTDERKAMSDDEFALPSKREFPIKDAEHVKLAHDMLNRAKGLSDAEREEAQRNIDRRAKELGIDTSSWKTQIKASAVSFSFANTASENPNKMPFKGVVTYFDAPSDKPPGGSGGRRVMIPSSVGIPALESLKGMGVNLAADADDHEVTHKIGVITDAYTGNLTAKGLEVIVEGHIFARDFPREAALIKTSQSALGFSYETANTLLASQEIDGEEVAVAQSLVFTGAAILMKKAAAYQDTSIAASAESKEDTVNVTAEELKALFGEFKTELLASVDAKLEAAKASDASDDADDEQQEQAENPKKGVKKVGAVDKGANEGGEVNASIDVEAIVAQAVAAALAAQKPADVQASADEKKPEAPQRRSFAPGTLLAKYDVQPEGEDLMAAIDKVAEKAGLDVSARMAMKLQAWHEQQNAK